MGQRRGEKIGWSAGWFGGFLWVAILAIVLMAKGQWVQGLLGLVLIGAAAISVGLCAPWKHPSKPYWQLMISPYAVFFLSVAWGLWSSDAIQAMDLNWRSLLWLLPLLIPFWTLSRRHWEDFDAQQKR